MGVLLDHTGAPILDSNGDWILTIGDAAVLPVQTVSVSLIGVSNTMSRTRQLYAAPGAVAVTGRAAALNPGRVGLSADPAAVSVSGAAAVVRKGAAIQADPNPYTSTGSAANLAVQKMTPFDLGEILLSGAEVSFMVGRAVFAEMAGVDLTGASADLTRASGATASLDAALGAVDINGYDVTLDINAINLLADSSSASIAGVGAFFFVDRGVIASPSTIAVSGASITSIPRFSMWAELASIAVSGADAATFTGTAFTLSADPGLVEVGAQTVEGLFGRSVAADAGQVMVRGARAEFTIAGGVYDSVLEFARQEVVTCFFDRQPGSSFMKPEIQTIFADTVDP